MVHQSLLLVFISVIVLFNTVYVESRPAIDDGTQNAATMCKLPALKGHCRALIPRWMYNPATSKCQEFHFGGCDGNANNFMSYKACMAVCGGIS